eukprot:3759382-Amphidinium_carterae.1
MQDVLASVARWMLGCLQLPDTHSKEPQFFIVARWALNPVLQLQEITAYAVFQTYSCHTVPNTAAVRRESIQQRGIAELLGRCEGMVLSLIHI